MKLSKIILPALICGAISTSAFAADNEGWYAGSDIKSVKGKYGKEAEYAQKYFVNRNGTVKNKKSTYGLNLNGGYNFNEYFGLEGGIDLFSMKDSYTHTLGNVKFTITYKTRNNLYVDALGYLPLTEDFKLEGAIGVGAYHSEMYATDTLNDVANLDRKQWNPGLRVGAGAIYSIDNNWDLKVRYRHQKGNEERSPIKKLNTISLGVAYNFNK